MSVRRHATSCSLALVTTAASCGVMLASSSAFMISVNCAPMFCVLCFAFCCLRAHHQEAFAYLFIDALLKLLRHSAVGELLRVVAPALQRQFRLVGVPFPLGALICLRAVVVIAMTLPRMGLLRCTCTMCTMQRYATRRAMGYTCRPCGIM